MRSSFRQQSYRESHALDSLIVDETLGLLVGDQKIGVQPARRTSFAPQFLEGDGALRDAANVLHHEDVARHQVGPGDTSKLVVGEVPWLHKEDHSKWAAFHMSLADSGVELHWREESLGVLSIVRQDLGAVPGLLSPAAHEKEPFPGQNDGVIASIRPMPSQLQAGTREPQPFAGETTGWSWQDAAQEGSAAVHGRHEGHSVTVRPGTAERLIITI